MKYAVCLILCALLLVSCGDSSVGDDINGNNLPVYSTVEDLPPCTAANEGEQLFVKSEGLIRVCADEKWFATTNQFGGCTTKALSDSSGVKILCDGDSVGVVLNGKNGTNGKVVYGDSLPDTSGKELVLDSERVALSMDSLAGYSQKGPFLRGSTVYLYELESGRTLKQTNGNFTSTILSDDGRYRFLARDLVSQYAMLVVEGNYRNEVTGKVSDNKIRLKAITDLSKHTTANVNLLTDLEFERVHYLVTKEKKKVYEAKRTAQAEILNIFHITLKDKTDAEDMDVFGSSEADAALLAISILLQGDRTEAELMALLAEISLAMAETGKWEGDRADSIKTAMADWAFGQKLSKFRDNVEGWALSDKKLGDFEKFVESFIAEIYGIKTCGEKSDATEQAVQNKGSIFCGRKYECYREKDWKRATWIRIGLKDKDLIEGVDYGYTIDWRNRRLYRTIRFMASEYGIELFAENMDFEYRVDGKPYGSRCNTDNCEKYGRYYTWAAAMDSAAVYSSDGKGCGNGKMCTYVEPVQGICPEGWRLTHVGVWSEMLMILKVQGEEAAPKMKSRTGWNENGDGTDDYGFSILPASSCCFNDEFYEVGESAGLWSSTDKTDSYGWEAIGYSLYYNNDEPQQTSLLRSSMYNVRCDRYF